MKKTPKFRVFVIIWGILLCYLTFDFIKDAKEDFVQFNYEWNKIEILDAIGNVSIDSISHDYLAINKAFTISESLDPKNSFSLESDNKNYFRASEIFQSDSSIVFLGIQWINRIPKNDLKNANLEIINLPLIQPEGKTTTTLGDSQIIWREARELRRGLSLKSNLFFKGRKSDAYGYPYEGGTFDTTANLISKIPEIDPTAFYILFFGAQDKALDANQLSINICEIFRLLENKRGVEQIFAITLPPSSNPDFNEFNTSFNLLLLACAREHTKIKTVNLHKYLEDKQDYLAEDEVHLNEKGYSYLNKLLRTKLK